MNENVANVDDNPKVTNFEEPNGETTCKIVFENNPNRVYHTGQDVIGCVNLSIYEATTVRAIYANIVGRGHCSWTTSSGSSKHRNYTKNMREEFYFNRKIYYVGSQNNKSGRIVVEPGEYKCSFEHNIPEECHTSVEEDTGFIRYSVAVVIEEDDENKKEFVESFTVINPLNLNHDESYSYPMSDEAEFILTKYCCCLCCWLTEPVKFSVKVPMKGYAPGQAIEITINVDNKSNHTYNNFIGNIFKTVEFYANDKTKTSTDKLVTFDCEGCVAGEKLSRLLIVTVPPTPRTETSDICSISYHLTVEAYGPCCDDDLKLEFPLTIGSYPIERTNTETGGIVVTEQPTKVLGEGDGVQVQEKFTGESSSMQPLLKEISSSLQSSSFNEKQKTIVQPDFQAAESNRSDEDYEKSYRPMYPIYTNSKYPLTCTLRVEAGEMKPIKM